MPPFQTYRPRRPGIQAVGSAAQTQVQNAQSPALAPRAQQQMPAPIPGAPPPVGGPGRRARQQMPRPQGPGTTPGAPPTPAPAPTPLLQPGVPGSTITPFGPEAGDLRGGMITPGTSARGGAATARTDASANSLAGFQRPRAIGTYADDFNERLNVDGPEFQSIDGTIENPGAINPEDFGDLSEFRDMRLEGARGLTSGASRSQIARDRLAEFDAMESPQLRNQLRAVGQRAASLGRLGMGDTAVEALTPFTDYLTRRAGMERGLAADTAEGEISDRRNLLSDTRGLVSDEESMGSGRRSELRGERGYATDLEERNLDRRLDERDAELGLGERNVDRRLQTRRQALEMGLGATDAEQAGLLGTTGLLGDLEGDIYGREGDQRGELRDERDFQTMTGRQAIEDLIRQRQMERGDFDSERSYGLAQDALLAGQNPAGVFMGAAGQYGQAGSAGYGNAANLLGQWLARPRRTSGG